MKLPLDPVPVREGIKGIISQVWRSFFENIFKAVSKTLPSVSGDNGDASVTLTSGSARTQRFNTALTAARTVTLPTTEVFDGMKFTVVRESGATGAFNLEVGALKSLTSASEWAVVEYDGSAWRLTQYGSL